MYILGHYVSLICLKGNTKSEVVNEMYCSLDS